MSELESLSNDQLRIELLKFGFANMPVTQTTRKVLIKKLKVAMEMQKSKTRRETVAVMKASDDDEPLELARSKKEKTPRRATVGVVEKTKKVPATTTTQNGADTPPKSKSPSRRSSRATPAKDRPIVSSSAYLQDQSDDDVIEIVEPIPIPTRRSKSKTPTVLAQSETVRISQYATNVRNIPIVREEETSTEEEDKSFEKEFQEPAPVLINRRATNVAPMSYSKYTTRTITPTDTYNSGTSYTKRSNYATMSVEQEDDDDEEDDGEEINAPYLSNFAKRLSTLRAEPLDAGMSKYKKETENYNYGRNVPSTSTYNNYRYSSSQYSKPLSAPRQDGVLTDMAREFDKMDSKFSIRKYVYICLIIMIIVAIYVILFT